MSRCQNIWKKKKRVLIYKLSFNYFKIKHIECYKHKINHCQTNILFLMVKPTWFEELSCRMIKANHKKNFEIFVEIFMIRKFSFEIY